MDFMVLDKNYDAIAMIDTFISAIWTVRYDEAGDFELQTPVRLDYLKAMQIGNYLWYRKSDRLMIIETVEIDSDVEDGATLLISGRSLESILDRRIVATASTITGNVQEVLFQILNNEIIQADTKRQIPGFSLKTNSDPKITSTSLEVGARGQNVYDVVCSLCQEYKIGWKILPSGTGGFIFSLYVGIDRSYDQNAVPYVVFSPSFENLLNSNYIKSYKAYKNTVYAVGTYQKEVESTDSGNDTYTTYEEAEVTAWAFSEDTEPTGLARREIYADNGGVNDGEQGGSATSWNAVNKQKGLTELSDHQTTTAFEGELETSRQYVYGEDFDIGDIVQIENEYGIDGTVYISEIVMSQDASGIKITPTFTSTEDETIE